MSGSVIGGLKCAKSNKEKFGEDWYREIGRKGGCKATTKPKGFAANPGLARSAGAAGGRKSRRGKPVSDEYVETRRKIYDYQHRVRRTERKLASLEWEDEIKEVKEQLEEYKKELKKYQERIKKL